MNGWGSGGNDLSGFVWNRADGVASASGAAATREACEGGLRGRLRDATRSLHHAVDHHPLLAPLARPDLQPEQYLHVLRTFLWIHATLQPVLVQAIANAGRPYELADRIAWLHGDFEAFRVVPGIRPHPFQAATPGDSAALAGMLYVIEGSMLGGRVIARQLAKSLDIGRETGARFFSGWGDETGPRWEVFLRYAEAICPLQHGEVAVAAAMGLFKELLRGLDEASTWKGQACS